MSAHPTGRIDHVIFCVEPHNAERAVGEFETLLDIRFEGPYDLPAAGLRVWIDWTSGVEVFTPTDPERAVAQRDFLDTNGEGVFRVCFNVADRDAVLERAEEMGHTVGSRYDIRDLHPDWAERFTMGKESHLSPIHGVSLNICELAN